jgi:hypothetical protein
MIKVYAKVNICQGLGGNATVNPLNGDLISMKCQFTYRTSKPVVLEGLQ